MITLGIETSCDETAAAVVKDGKVLSSAVSSSVHLHSQYGGVVPEIASRYHSEYMLPVVKEALAEAGCSPQNIDLVAVTKGPGLPGSLIVGLAFAKAISFARDIPLIGVDHLRAHLFSCFLGKGEECVIKDKFPFVGMVVSGGHTSIFKCLSVKDLEVIGRTKDDAVGEAYDKVARVLGLGYPGGPAVEKRAAGYIGGKTIGFPRAMLDGSAGLDFSFSGLKTAVLYYWRDSDKTEVEKSRICRAFQEAIADVVDAKVKRAAHLAGCTRLAVGGGVINNEVLRARLTRSCKDEGIELFIPNREYCADNAAMVAVTGQLLYTAGERSDLYMGVCPTGACLS